GEVSVSSMFEDLQSKCDDRCSKAKNKPAPDLQMRAYSRAGRPFGQKKAPRKKALFSVRIRFWVQV
ncbi:MAG: hypothetical protein ACLUNJ_26930, partial [Enterocloster sp.]|uniref:hypothetical protein n=1 Tax=Enterocloster sp. TaxID=2719315 RepID=UPI0039946C21